MITIFVSLSLKHTFVQNLYTVNNLESNWGTPFISDVALLSAIRSCCFSLFMIILAVVSLYVHSNVYVLCSNKVFPLLVISHVFLLFITWFIPLQRTFSELLLL